MSEQNFALYLECASLTAITGRPDERLVMCWWVPYCAFW